MIFISQRESGVKAIRGRKDEKRSGVEWRGVIFQRLTLSSSRRGRIDRSAPEIARREEEGLSLPKERKTKGVSSFFLRKSRIINSFIRIGRVEA